MREFAQQTSTEILIAWSGRFGNSCFVLFLSPGNFNEWPDMETLWAELAILQGRGMLPKESVSRAGGFCL